jgi:hypothetical protein
MAMAAVRGYLRTRAALQIEVVALRHQRSVLQRSVKLVWSKYPRDVAARGPLRSVCWRLS